MKGKLRENCCCCAFNCFVVLLIMVPVVDGLDGSMLVVGKSGLETLEEIMGFVGGGLQGFIWGTTAAPDGELGDSSSVGTEGEEEGEGEEDPSDLIPDTSRFTLALLF